MVPDRSGRVAVGTHVVVRSGRRVRVDGLVVEVGQSGEHRGIL